MEKRGKKVELFPEEENIRRKFLENFFSSETVRDFCKNYRLEDEIKEKTFNKRYSSPELIHVFFKKNDYTKYLFKAIRTRAKNNSFAVFVIYGEPNSGKSEVAQFLAFYIKAAMKKAIGLDVNVHLGFSNSEFKSILRKMKRGDVAIRDENSKLSGAGSVTIKKNVNNIIELVRENQNCFIFVRPKREKNSVVSYYLETAGKNKENRTCRCIIYDPSFKEGRVPIGRVFIPLHVNEKFRKEYREKKTRNIQKLLKRSGLLTDEIDAEIFQRDLEALVEHCKKYGVMTKRGIESQIVVFNHKQRNEEDKIKGTTPYIRAIVDNVYLILRGKKINVLDEGEEIEKEEEMKEEEKVEEKEEEKVVKKEPKKKEKKEKERWKTKRLDLTVEENKLKVIQSFKFLLNDSEIIEIAKSECNLRNKERDFNIYKMKKMDSLLYHEILKKYPKLEIHHLKSIVKKVSAIVASVKGKLFEQEFFEFLQNENLYDSIYWEGTPGRPDIYAYYDLNKRVHIFSLKYMSYAPGKMYVPIRGLRPEIKSAVDLSFSFEDVKLFLVCLDNDNNRVSITEVDYRSLPKTIRVFD